MAQLSGNFAESCRVVMQGGPFCGWMGVCWAWNLYGNKNQTLINQPPSPKPMANRPLIIRPAISGGGYVKGGGCGWPIMEQKSTATFGEWQWLNSITQGLAFCTFFFPKEFVNYLFVIVRKKNTMENNLEKSDVLNWLGSITSSPLTDVHISGEQSSDCHYHIWIELNFPKTCRPPVRCVTHRCWPIGSLVLLGDCVADVWLLLSRSAFFEFLDLNFTKIFGVVYAPKQLL